MNGGGRAEGCGEVRPGHEGSRTPLRGLGLSLSEMRATGGLCTVGSFFFFLLNFYWSIADLQCVSFCCTAK